MIDHVIYFCLEFLLAVILILAYYFLFVIRRLKRKQKEGSKAMPTELELFFALGKLDQSKFDKVKLMRRIAIINAIDVGIILVMTEITSSIILKLLLALVLVFIFVIISYKLLIRYYRKKGYGKDVQPHKN